MSPTSPPSNRRGRATSPPSSSDSAPSGFVGVVRSDLPIGAGLSSSAALEVATALALGADGLDPLALAPLCRDAEHDARGVPTGLLDQLASALGVADHALLIDCSINTVTPTPLPPADEAEFVVIPGAPRDLADTGYAERVDECRRAEAEIGPLRAATLDDVEQLADDILRRRARHVVSENDRVHEFATALAAGQLRDAGQLMDASHRSLRDDYESSTPDHRRPVRRTAIAGPACSAHASPAAAGAGRRGAHPPRHTHRPGLARPRRRRCRPPPGRCGKDPSCRRRSRRAHQGPVTKRASLTSGRTAGRWSWRRKPRRERPRLRRRQMAVTQRAEFVPDGGERGARSLLGATEQPAGLLAITRLDRREGNRELTLVGDTGHDDRQPAREHLDVIVVSRGVTAASRGTG